MKALGKIFSRSSSGQTSLSTGQREKHATTTRQSRPENLEAEVFENERWHRISGWSNTNLRTTEGDPRNFMSSYGQTASFPELPPPPGCAYASPWYVVMSLLYLVQSVSLFLTPIRRCHQGNRLQLLWFHG